MEAGLRARPRAFSRLAAFGLALAAMALVGGSSAADQQPSSAGPAVERLGKDLFRLGRVRVNTATREVSVSGTINPVTVLEFLANPPKGLKAYESALTLDTDGVTFNTALVLIGLERTHARLLPNRSLDGDRVEVWVDLPGPPPKRVRGERLIFDRLTNQEATESAWIYTGSSFLDRGEYWADSDGVLIGFVHSGAGVIERAETLGVGRYGSIILNPGIGLQPGMPVTLTVKAIGQITGGAR